MAPRIRIPKAEDFASLKPDLTVSLHFPSPPESMTAILILFHGLGDSEIPFASFARNVNLPGVLAISVRGTNPLPPSLLGEPLDSGPTRNFHWGNDVNLAPHSDGLDADPGFSKAADLISNRLIKGTLVEKCGWELSDILFFGFGQGGSLALGLASKLRDAEASRPFKGVVSIGGVLPVSMIPSQSGRPKAKTPVLVCHGESCEAVDGDAIDVLKKEFADEYSRKSAIKILDKSEVTQGIFLPCITYGKAQSALVQARKNRAGEDGEAGDTKSQNCNGPCVSYAALCTVLPFTEEFGGGILARKQRKEVGDFYNLKQRRDTPIDIVAHNATTIRNLAEVRFRENLPLTKAQRTIEQKFEPYRSHLPMRMRRPWRKRDPKVETPQDREDVPEAKEHRIGSGVEKLKQKLKRKAPEQPPESPKQKKPKFHGLFTAKQPVQEAREEPKSTQSLPQTATIAQPPASSGVHNLKQKLMGKASEQPDEQPKPDKPKHHGFFTPKEPAQEAHDEPATDQPLPHPVTIAQPLAGSGVQNFKQKPTEKAPEQPDEPPKQKKSKHHGLFTAKQPESDQPLPQTSTIAQPPAGSSVQHFKKKLMRKAPESPAEPSKPKAPIEGPFMNFMAVGEPAQEAQEELQSDPPIPLATIAETPLPPVENVKSKSEEVATESHTGAAKSGEGKTERAKNKVTSLFKKSQKSKIQDSVKDTELTDVTHMQENIPQILIAIEPPVTTAEPLEHVNEITEPCESDRSDEEGQTIREIPAGARVHSLSDDTILISKAPRVSNIPHRLSADQIVTPVKAPVAYVLEQDQAAQAKPVRQAPRLSEDTMVTMKVAPTGNYLEGDPAVSGPQQVLSHELLDDPVVQERAVSPMPHTLESDKRAAAAAGVAKTDEPQAEEPVRKARSKRTHDISQDVRVLSPSGRVLALHAVDDEEIVRRASQFPKSPHPNAVPGLWVVTASEQNGSGLWGWLFGKQGPTGNTSPASQPASSPASPQQSQSTEGQAQA
ncbi:hypothetical protein VP1G_00063 [Cytospora mali]|uniref:Phospholipase/carboxylesterase/thioesterase domain-containing protein n=1 Tax=Cytospora mali TaxID=578113 RepID=A0A194ULS1_CYTMA|nr:hypothetical protein VP1G_00063 [Valsa mali var. pyri (nom. inval.)]